MTTPAIHHMGVSEGPTCAGCDTTEAGCAYLHGACCRACTHWPDDDTPSKPKQPSRRHADVAPTEPRHAVTLTADPPHHAAVTHIDAPTHRCKSCGRRTGRRRNGTRIRHRTEADNPLAPYCPGDDQ